MTIISFTNLFQHLVLAEILFEWKSEFILPYLVRNSQINARNKMPSNILPLLMRQGLVLNIGVKSM